MFNRTMSSVEELHKSLAHPHDAKFKGHTCEEVHEAFRYLSDEGWAYFSANWQGQSADWIANLAYCLDPDYHPHVGEVLLIAILEKGGRLARACAADTLLFDSLYVPDSAMRVHLQAYLVEARSYSDAELCTYHSHLFQGLLEKKAVERIPEVHVHSSNNRAELAEGIEAACYHCRSIFKAEEVSEFIDGGETALCPCCGIDAVLSETAGYPLNYMTLRALNRYWFGN